jgi:hypothetical protein
MHSTATVVIVNAIQQIQLVLVVSVQIVLKLLKRNVQATVANGKVTTQLVHLNLAVHHVQLTQTTVVLLM